MSFADRLDAAVRSTQNPSVVGLDPHLGRMPAEFEAAHSGSATAAEVAADVERFLFGVIDAVQGIVPAVKPQSAFYEALGSAGVVCWERVVKRSHEAGLLVIGDVKRGDIGSTAAAYAQAFLTGGPGIDKETLCDCVTINPYLGTDSVKPFVDACQEAGAGVYVLVRTSNPSSAELQAKGDPPLMHQVAELVNQWGSELIGESGFSSVGAVVGATHPEELTDLRGRMPKVPFLLPGYGAQGAGAADIKGGFSSGLSGALVNSSRGILFPNRSGMHWKDACREAAEEMAADLRGALL